MNAEIIAIVMAGVALAGVIIASIHGPQEYDHRHRYHDPSHRKSSNRPGPAHRRRPAAGYQTPRKLSAPGLPTHCGLAEQSLVHPAGRAAAEVQGLAPLRGQSLLEGQTFFSLQAGRGRTPAGSPARSPWSRPRVAASRRAVHPSMAVPTHSASALNASSNPFAPPATSSPRVPAAASPIDRPNSSAPAFRRQ